MPPSIAGQECLIENGDKYILTHVGDACPARSVLKQTGTMTVSGSTLKGNMRYSMGGVWRLMVESALSSISATRKPQALSAILSADRKSLTVENACLEPSAIDADSSVIVADICDSEGVKAVSARSKLYVMPRLFRFVRLKTVEARDRRYAIDCDGYYPVEADVTIDLPEGYVADALPRSYIIDNPWFEGHVTYSPCGDRQVRCTASLTQRRLEAGADEAVAWNEAVRQVQAASNSALILLKNE